jgi:hypothetical protein
VLSKMSMINPGHIRSNHDAGKKRKRGEEFLASPHTQYLLTRIINDK